jgi:hypothetical protein
VSTIYQPFGVQHVNGTNKPDFDALYRAGFRAVYYRPEDPRSGEFISQSKAAGFLVSGLWFADPSSSDSVAHGIRGDAAGFADDVTRIVRGLDALTGSNGRSCSPQVVQLNIEFTGKGYPTWRPNTDVKAWQRCVANGDEWQTWSDGTTGSTRPNFAGTGFPNVVGVGVWDGTVYWHNLNPAAYNGWDWNETVMARLRRSVPEGGMPIRPLVVQPMCHQGDFNYGAYLKTREYAPGKFSPPARVSPQCYSGDMSPVDPGPAIEEIVSNPYVTSHYPGVVVPRSYVHPSLASARSDFYMPGLKTLGLRGYTIFRADNMNAADYTTYREVMIT